MFFWRTYDYKRCRRKDSRLLPFREVLMSDQNYWQDRIKNKNVQFSLCWSKREATSSECDESQKPESAAVQQGTIWGSRQMSIASTAFAHKSTSSPTFSNVSTLWMIKFCYIKSAHQSGYFWNFILGFKNTGSICGSLHFGCIMYDPSIFISARTLHTLFCKGNCIFSVNVMKAFRFTTWHPVFENQKYTSPEKAHAAKEFMISSLNQYMLPFGSIFYIVHMINDLMQWDN